LESEVGLRSGTGPGASADSSDLAVLNTREMEAIVMLAFESEVLEELSSARDGKTKTQCC
jgi:hypothetical protein